MVQTGDNKGVKATSRNTNTASLHITWSERAREGTVLLLSLPRHALLSEL